MRNLDSLTDEWLEKSGVAHSNEGLREELIAAEFKDVFEIGMYAVLTQNTVRLDAEVKIGRDKRHIEDLIAGHSLQDKIEKLLETSQETRDYMLDHCKELVFTTTFTDPSPSNKKKVVYFHEFGNKGANLRKRWEQNATFIGGGLTASITSALAYNQFIASTPWINIGQQTLGWLWIPALTPSTVPLIMKLYGSKRRIWKRKREYLGKERITEVEITLDQRYKGWMIEEGSYSGQFDKYELYEGYGRRLNLKEWQSNNSSKPLFNVTMAGNPTSSLIWIVSLDAKIDKQRLSQERVRAFRYPNLAHERVKTKEFINNRYARELYLRNN